MDAENLANKINAEFGMIVEHVGERELKIALPDEMSAEEHININRMIPDSAETTVSSRTMVVRLN